MVKYNKNIQYDKVIVDYNNLDSWFDDWMGDSSIIMEKNVFQLSEG